MFGSMSPRPLACVQSFWKQGKQIAQPRNDAYGANAIAPVTTRIAITNISVRRSVSLGPESRPAVRRRSEKELTD
jgi:hypothetical protein